MTFDSEIRTLIRRELETNLKEELNTWKQEWKEKELKEVLGMKEKELKEALGMRQKTLAGVQLRLSAYLREVLELKKEVAELKVELVKARRFVFMDKGDKE